MTTIWCCSFVYVRNVLMFAGLTMPGAMDLVRSFVQEHLLAVGKSKVFYHLLIICTIGWRDLIKVLKWLLWNFRDKFYFNICFILWIISWLYVLFPVLTYLHILYKPLSNYRIIYNDIIHVVLIYIYIYTYIHTHTHIFCYISVHCFCVLAINNYLCSCSFIFFIYSIRLKTFILRNIQLQKAYTRIIYDLTSIHVIKRSIDLQLWIMVSGGWY